MAASHADIEPLRILQASCDWTVLGFDLSAAQSTQEPISTSQLRKRYHGLCLQVHPDKSSSSHATAAFRKLSTAYDRLIEAIQNGQISGVPTGPNKQATARPAGFTDGDMKWRKPSTTKPSQNKWWEGKSWIEIDKELMKEEAHLLREKAQYEARAKVRSAARHAKRKQNEARIASGLSDLYEKYNLAPTDFAGESNESATVSRPPCKRAKPSDNIMRGPTTKKAKSKKAKWPPKGPPSVINHARSTAEAVSDRRSLHADSHSANVQSPSTTSNSKWGHDGWTKMQTGKFTADPNRIQQRSRKMADYFIQSCRKPND